MTISLDALDDDTFGAMNDVAFPVARVLAGIDAAATAGLDPLKINMVVKRGVNDHRTTEMADYFRGSGHIVRFIEYMDVGTTNGWRIDDVVPAAEIIATINERWPLRRLLRAGAGDDQLATQIRSIWTYRADRYSELRHAANEPSPKIEMSYIGG